MKLSELLNYFPELKINDSIRNFYSKLNHLPEKSTQVMKVTNSSKDVDSNSIFVAIKGTHFDGHNFLTEVIEKSPIAIFIENEEKLEKIKNKNTQVYIVNNTRDYYHRLCFYLNGSPDMKLFNIGITGTNGKTSITYFLESLFQFYQIPIGIMGTVNHRVGDKIWTTENTTSDAGTIAVRLRQFLECGAQATALEVTSHALDQKRADSINFDVAIFTNLTRDHLDYHNSMKNYFMAKNRLFSELLSKSKKINKLAIINLDDPWGSHLQCDSSVKKVFFGQKKLSLTKKNLIIKNGFEYYQFSIKKLTLNQTEVEVTILTKKKKYLFSIPMIGQHSIYNLVTVLALADQLNMSFLESIDNFKNFKGVPGRLQKVISKNTDIDCFIDYAHTPDALENVLKLIKKVKKDRKLITVFGCGGDRDKGKRPLMATIAEKFSDKVIVTSDNPRTEDPIQIIKEITKGFKNKNKIVSIVDRKHAIHQAIQLNRKKSVIVICGKGHEDYQIIGTTKIHFSDYEEAKKAMESI